MGIYMNHLSMDEIDRITDTSDLSPEYLDWYESVEEHLADCARCREQIRRRVLCDDLSDGTILKTGIKLLEKEEEIRRDMVIAKLIQQGTLDQIFADAMREQRYVRLPLAPGRKGLAVYRGETGQEDMICIWYDNALKIIFGEEQFRGIDLENAKVILTDKSMKAGAEVNKPVPDENGHFTACFESIEETDDLLVYVVENKSERKGAAQNHAMYKKAFYEQSMTPPNEEHTSHAINLPHCERKNEKPVLEETEDSEHRKTNESEDDDA